MPPKSKKEVLEDEKQPQLQGMPSKSTERKCEEEKKERRRLWEGGSKEKDFVDESPTGKKEEHEKSKECSEVIKPKYCSNTFMYMYYWRHC